MNTKDFTESWFLTGSKNEPNDSPSGGNSNTEDVHDVVSRHLGLNSKPAKSTVQQQHLKTSEAGLC